MNLVKRFWSYVKSFINLFVEGMEDSIPLERRLADDRRERAGKFKQMMSSATDVMAQAELMVKELARVQIVAGNIRDAIKRHLQAAQAAGLRGDKITEQNEQASAAALADDLGEAEADVRDMTLMVEQALRDKQDAKRMVLDQANQLERLARKDASLVSRLRLTEMREQSLALRESLANLVPEDSTQIRARAEKQVDRRQAKVNQRSELVDALLAQQRRTQVTTTSTRRGSEILDEIRAEIGYSATKEEVTEEPVQASQSGTQ